MYVQAEKLKGNKNKATANSVAQKKSHVKEGFGFVNNRAEAIVQRVIRTKSGDTYNNAAILPSYAKSDTDIRDRAQSPDTWLVKSSGDLDKKGKGQQIPMLSPHRHLIGEVHNNSQFTTAEKDWGWGAQKSIESLQTSDTVNCSISDDNIAYNPIFGHNYMRGAAELENYHAYYMQTLSLYIAYLKRTKNAADALEQNVTFAILGDNDIDPSLKTAVSNELTDCTEYGKETIKHMIDYENACNALVITVASTPAEIQLNVLHTRMTGNWDALRDRIEEVRTSPMNKIVSENWEKDAFKTRVMVFRTRLNTLIGEITQLGTDIKNVLVQELPAAPDQLIANQSWANATALGSENTLAPLHGIGPIRELFMERNVNALTVPAIIQIGSQHVLNLNGMVNNGKYHNSYNDFRTDTLT